MTSYEQGSTAPLTVQFLEYPGGPAVDVTDLTVTITPTLGGPAVVGPTGTGISSPGTGLYVYNWGISGLVTPGDYLVAWVSDEAMANETVTVTVAASVQNATDDEVWYITREEVQNALDEKSTVRSSSRIDQAIRQGSRDVEGLTHRKFYPHYGTWYFDRPAGMTLWLNEHEFMDVTGMAVGDEELAEADYILQPMSGPPWRWIDRNRSGSGWPAASTEQRAVGITGVKGSSNAEVPAGTFSAAVNAQDTTVYVTDGAAVGVGALLRCGSERMIVTDKLAVDTTQTINANVAAQNNATTVAVDTGSDFTEGEVLLIDAEKMLITDVAGNNLVVKRGWDGTVLAAHTSGAAVYAYRRCTVRRGVLGTTAAGHAQGASLLRNSPPSLVGELTLAYALRAILQGRAGYSAVVGSGDNERESAGRGVKAIEADCYRRHGRQGRMRSV
jgi:hypothetical protein